MKIDRVVFCLNSSPLYSGMWDIVAEVYEKTTSIIPTLVFCGTKDELKEEVKTKYGDVYLLNKYSNVIVNPNLDWSVTWSSFWAIANLFPNDNCVLSGIDEIPISSTLWDKLSFYKDDKYIVPLGAHPYAQFGLHGIIASGYNCGKGSIFKDIFQIENDLEKELNKVWNNKYRFSERIPRNLRALELQNWWGLDEAYISSIVYDNPNVEFFEDGWAKENLFSRRICRSRNLSYDKEKLQNKYYWSAHILRPLSNPNNMKKVEQMLKDMNLR